MAKMNYPVAIGDKETKLRFTPSETLPMTIVIGRDRSILDIIEGILLPEEFEAKIKPLLRYGNWERGRLARTEREVRAKRRARRPRSQYKT